MTHFCRYGIWLWARVTQLTSWSHLSVFGNSHLARLAVLSPIVAIFVKLQKEYLSNTIGFTHVEWLYWSLISIACGQALYLISADRTIKKYGLDKQKFIMEASATWTTKEFDLAKLRQLKWFVIGENSLLAIDPNLNESDTESKLNEAIKEFGWKFTGINIKQDIVRGMNYFKQIEKQEASSSSSHFKFLGKALCHILNYEKQLISHRAQQQNNSEEILADLKRLCTAYHDEQNGESDVRKLVLSWHYDQANEEKLIRRRLVAALYTIGGLYFLWRSISAFLYMIGIPLVNFDTTAP